MIVPTVTHKKSPISREFILLSFTSSAFVTSILLLWSNKCEGLKSYPGQQHDVGDEGKKHRADIAENPDLKRREPTVVVGSVSHHRIEDADLAEKDRDQGGGPRNRKLRLQWSGD